MTALRWIAFIPLALLTSGIFNAVALFVLRATTLSPSLVPEGLSAALATFVASGVSGIALVLVAAVIAPNHKRRSARIVAIGAAILTGVFVLLYLRESDYVQASSRVAALGGLGVGYYFASSKYGS